MPTPALLFNALSMAERLCWFSVSWHQHQKDSQHPYAGYREVHSHLPGYPSTSAFCLGSQGVGIATSGRGEAKEHGRGKQDAVVIQFLFGVIDNSRRVLFHHSHQTQWNSYRLPGGFEPGISWATADVMHFTVRETLCTWESLQPRGERGSCGLECLMAVLIPSAPWAPFWAKEPTQNTSDERKCFHVSMYSCEYWMLLKMF